MKPFRTSVTARMISLAATIALTGGGAAVALATHLNWTIPLVLLAAIMAGIVGLALGAYDHPGPVVLLAVLLPMALWPYVMVLELVRTSYPTWSWALIAAGLVPLLLTTVLAPITVRAHATAKQATQSA
jgi:hypothetical protein